MFLIDTGLDHGEDRAFGRADVPGLFWEMGDSYESITVDRVDFSRGRPDAVSVYRNLTYDLGCACVRYTTDAMRIPFD